MSSPQKLSVFLQDIGKEPPFTLWAEICDEIARELGGTRAAILPVSSDRFVPWAAHSTNFRATLLQLLGEGWTMKDVRLELPPDFLTRAYLLKSDLGITDGSENTLLARFFLGPLPEEDWIGFPVSVEDDHWIVSINMPIARRKAYILDDTKIHELQSIVAELMQGSVQLANQHWQGISQALKLFGEGMICLDAAGDIIDADPIAKQLLRRFGVNAYATPFKKAFPGLFLKGAKRLDATRLARLASEPESDADLLLEILPLPPALRHFSSEVVEIVKLCLRPKQDETLRKVMIQHFGLLPSEVDFALLLCKGMKVKDAAEVIRIKESTARQRLKSIFRKVEVESQHQLIVAILSKSGILSSATNS